MSQSKFPPGWNEVRVRKVIAYCEGQTEEQDAVAEWLLAELASEEEWDKRFAESQGALSVLAQEALDEHERG